MAMGVYDSDDFQIVRRAVTWRNRVTNVLADSVLVRKKFFRHFFVDNADTPGLFAFAFRLREIATAQELHPDRIEISGRDGSIERTRADIRRFWIGRKRFAGRHDPTGVCEIPVRQHRSDADRANAGQLSRSFDNVED